MAFRFLIVLSFLFAFRDQAKPVIEASVGKIVFKNAYYADPLPTGEFTTIVIPIKRAQNLIVVEAKIDTMQGNFILDTGAPYLVLNQTYFRNALRYGDQEAAGLMVMQMAHFKQLFVALI